MLAILIPALIIGASVAVYSFLGALPYAERGQYWRATAMPSMGMIGKLANLIWSAGLALRRHR